jgi:hypothetical protein
MEPVFMALGEASGIAAMKAQSSRTSLRALEVKSVQREILKRGGVILYESKSIVPEDIQE